MPLTGPAGDTGPAFRDQLDPNPRRLQTVVEPTVHAGHTEPVLSEYRAAANLESPHVRL